MQTLAEGEVGDVVAVDVEGVGVVVAAGVTVRRAEQWQHGASGRHRGAVALEIPGHPNSSRALVCQPGWCLDIHLSSHQRGILGRHNDLACSQLAADLQIRLGLCTDLLHRDARRELYELKAIGGHVDDCQVGNDPLDDTPARQGQ